MNVFAVSYYAPPQLTPQSIQVGRLLYHLDAKVTLLYGRDAQFNGGYDQYPDFFQRIGALEVRDPGPFVTGLPLRLWRRLVPIHGNIPDALGRWRRKAVRPALQALHDRHYDALASFGMPMSGHLLAYQLKRRTGLPWLVHFSDPWTRNPFHRQGPVAAPVNEWMEKRVIAASDQILFTSQRTLELVMDKYPDSWRAKAAVLPHAWDMEHFAASPSANPLSADMPLGGGIRHVIRHIGNCYGTRSPVPLFEALALLDQRHPRLLDGVCFDFVGYVRASALASPVFQALRPGLVRVRGQVDYRASLELMRSASALLVIDAPSDQPSVFLPSKLIEYIGARRPVWGITPAGTSADLIAEWAGADTACASPDDVAAIARMLETGLRALDDAVDDDNAGVPEHLVQRYCAARVSGALRGHIVQAIARCPGASAATMSQGA